MPTYVYHCSACMETYEVEQRITEDALTDCRCGAKGTIKRVIQPVAVAFKGSGFHINDYAAKPEESKSESSTESKTETKSEPTETKAEAPTSEPAVAPAAAPKTD